MNTQSFAQVSPKSFQAYPRGDFDLESGNPKKPRNTSTIRSIKSLNNRILYYFKLRPLIALFVFLSFGVVALIILSVHVNGFHLNSREKMNLNTDSYPFSHLRNLVMVAGHSIYTSSSCGKVEQEDSWFLEPYQKNPGQAATFLLHIRKGVEVAAKDEEALLLFSGGETRKDAGPRSEAQSYWAVAEWKNWFGKQEAVKHRALTEEHARDSFENLLFSICRFRELTGTFPHNITVIGYDFKEDRFANLHRSAIRYPESRFYYFGTPTSPVAKDAARKGEEMVKLQFYQDPYGCSGSLLRKKLKRDPFHRSIPYPNGCPELRGLFTYCAPIPYPGPLPWAQQ